MDSYLTTLLNSGAELYEVGGVVRDKLLKRTTKDIDYLVRRLSIQQIKEILEPFGKVALVGQSFGVVKFFPHNNTNLTIDFSLPRKEFSTGTGHRDFDVSFDPSISVENDLNRRDFTINAMAINIKTNEFLDPFCGKKDLSDKILKQVFPNAFVEDPLRMLRGIQFASRFNLTIEENTFASMKSHAKLIKTVSPERISEELKKLLSAPKPSSGFSIMYETGLMKHVLPELETLKGIGQDKQPGEDVYDHTMRVLDAAVDDPAIDYKGEINLVFAALLHDTGKAVTSRFHEEANRIVFFGHQIVSARIAKKILKRLKAETIGVNIDTVTKLINNHMFETKAFFSEKAIRRFIHKVGKDLIFPLIDLRIADKRGGKHPHAIKGVLRLKKKIIEELEKKPPFGPKDLAINGNDIKNLGIEEGPQIGIILNKIVEAVLDEPKLNTKEELLLLAKKLTSS